ncbi:MAG: single-stranded-DNA-specific exonuclease RecJ [Mariprofundaceae bacterium]|nr:single-stranded-DNA-specific exonuclease RecJ [Mariprofundaceae bacterium]
MQLPDNLTVRGKKVSWRHEALQADEPLLAWDGLLKARGLHASDAYFSPKLSELPNPFDMQDMIKAAERVVAAVLASERIHIFGDFDCDGVSGTAILTEALQAAGASVTFSIPHRADDGHGIGVEPVREAVERGVHLGISVDTGTTCFDACDAAVELGFDLIVSDHHLPEQSPEETLPKAFALLNPAREDCGFADRKLCGTGVAFFLLMAVWKLLSEQGKRPDYDLRTLLDRVAVATIADVMDLVGVNRILVYHGLQRLNTQPCVGMSALMKVARVKSAVTAETIGFYLAPRINAAGRMRHGEEAMRLLCTQDISEAEHLAGVLDETNKQRRKVEAEVFKQAELMLGDAHTLAVNHKDWHAGVVGLAAGRLARKHGRPAAVGFIDGNNNIRVSLRGVSGFHIGNLLHACSDFLEGFGGHAGAGGGSIKAGKWTAFVAAFAKAIQEQESGENQHMDCLVDGVLGLQAMHVGLAERLQRFEPIGRGNPACTWLLKDVHIAERKDLKGGVMRLSLSDGHRYVPSIVFGGGALSDSLQAGQVVSVLGQLKVDDWRGNGAIQFVVEDVIDSVVENIT